MITYFDPITAKQLQGCVEAVYKKDYFSFMEMFNCKLKFAIDICKKWTSEKFFRKNYSLDMFSKIMMMIWQIAPPKLRLPAPTIGVALHAPGHTHLGGRESQFGRGPSAISASTYL